MFKQSKINYIKLSKLYNLTLNPETSWCERKIRVVTKTNSEKNCCDVAVLNHVIVSLQQ
ncbi:hypothetical protein LRHMDP2_2907 [Lacticaseibacillus rhamnosus LRHMDP2]|uniref:Mobile element protein n=1 Tax=Lacticaseibacillus rhamnosus LRHMDP3 TaxID=1203259 RepID=A0AB33XWS9_LACRH|nr:hypothetical protein LRHMDP2_2907 [Lacticaseibacillus rhamnosus LRHMDP2]EKS52250.1 hypothetical protein LRHMDP3_621 [Lacticaseibacillus rhamnosus LRHMDP3]